MELTQEQLDGIDLFLKGKSIKLVARAGCGKTFECVQLAKAVPHKQVTYVAFNKAIVLEAREKMPSNVNCSTAHSLAFQEVGKRYKNRMDQPRMKSADVAKILGAKAYFAKLSDGTTKVLQVWQVVNVIKNTVGQFCQSGDRELTTAFVPYIDGIDLPEPGGKRTYANNNALAAMVLPMAKQLWDDIVNPHGRISWGREHYYLKIWQVYGTYDNAAARKFADPKIAADVILFDEGQDANPVMLAAILAQTHCQIVFVGDPEQQIYEWTGAVNALGKVQFETAYLSQSFRFGPAIAEAANVFLDALGADPLVKGLESIDAVVGPVEEPHAVLCRTNAAAISELLAAQKAGQPAHLVGGDKEIASFATAALDLSKGLGTTHPDLCMFANWGEVQNYVRDDESGADLALMVRIMDEYGADVIVEALAHMPKQGDGVLTISTAHKAKGREWKTVRLAGDFKCDDNTQPSELRLLYVAVTRAQQYLDPGPLAKVIEENLDGGDDDDEPVQQELVAASTETQFCSVCEAPLPKNRYGVGICDRCSGTVVVKAVPIKQSIVIAAGAAATTSVRWNAWTAA